MRTRRPSPRSLYWVLWIVAMLLAPAGAGAQQKYDLKIMTGPMGGAWYPLGGAIADAIQKQIPEVTFSVMPGGGIGNVEALEVGKCEIGFANSCSAVDGLFGRAPFKKKMENMRQLANLYPQYFQMAVAEASGIKSVAEMKGKVLACDRKGLIAEIPDRLVFASDAGLVSGARILEVPVRGIPAGPGGLATPERGPKLASLPGGSRLRARVILFLPLRE